MKSLEQKAVAALEGAAAHLAFNERAFAALIGNLDPQIQQNIMRAFMACVDFWAMDAENEGWYTTQNEATVKLAAKIKKAVGSQHLPKVL